MHAWIEELDDGKQVHSHSVERTSLETVADWCRDMAAAGGGNGKDEKLAMRCDGFTIMAWCNARGVSWAEFFNNAELQTKFLDDPDNSPFRVWKGRI